MTKEGLIDQTIDALKKLPENKVLEIADFTEFLLKKYEEKNSSKRIRIAGQ